MKKIISLILSVIIICLAGTVYADSLCRVTLQPNKVELAKNEEFTVDVVLANIQDEKGIFGLSAVLEYDENSLEYIGMDEQEGWDGVSYNKENGKITIIRENDYAKNSQTVFKITFKTKAENKENVEITLKDVTITNGTKEDKIENLKSIVNIKTNSQGNNNTGNNNTNSGNNNFINNTVNNNNSDNKNSSSNNILKNNKKDGILPNAGNAVGTAMLAFSGIVLFGMLAIVLYVKIRKISKMEKC